MSKSEHHPLDMIMLMHRWIKLRLPLQQVHQLWTSLCDHLESLVCLYMSFAVYNSQQCATQDFKVILLVALQASEFDVSTLYCDTEWWWIDLTVASLFCYPDSLKITITLVKILGTNHYKLFLFGQITTFCFLAWGWQFSFDFSGQNSSHSHSNLEDTS